MHFPRVKCQPVYHGSQHALYVLYVSRFFRWKRVFRIVLYTLRRFIIICPWCKQRKNAHRYVFISTLTSRRMWQLGQRQGGGPLLYNLGNYFITFYEDDMLLFLLRSLNYQFRPTHQRIDVLLCWFFKTRIHRNIRITVRKWKRKENPFSHETNRDQKSRATFHLNILRLASYFRRLSHRVPANTVKCREKNKFLIAILFCYCFPLPKCVFM